MKIYNQDKTKIIKNPDLTKGYLLNDKLLISNEEAEEWHFEVKTYDNGGKETFKVVDKPYKPAEFEEIQVYVLYTNKELANNLKQKLAETDYKAIKFAEGLISAEDYEPIKLQRQKWRDEINKLEGGGNE